MNKRIQKSQISIGLLMMCVIVMPALLFSSCKKKAPPVPAEIYYTVTFNSQGGSAVSPITGVKPGSTITLPASPTKAGFTFTFGGWCIDKGGKYLFSPTTPINSDLTLYAKWIEQFYTVTFNSQGGSAVNPITGVKPGSTITLPASPTKAGFTFDGWCTDKEGKSWFSPITTINSDRTLYAKWIEQLYTVTFDSQGGSAVDPITGVKYGSTVTLPIVGPTKAGVVFRGWHTDKEGKSSFSPTTPITADLTLYAKWKDLPRDPEPDFFSLSSASFTNGDKIPPKHFYLLHRHPGRFNASPPLSWEGAPKGTNSFLIIMEDFDKPRLPLWTVFDIPANRYSLAENDPWLPPAIDKHFRNGQYRGPCPPFFNKKKHTIQIMIFALDMSPFNFAYYNCPTSEAEARRTLGVHILQTAYIRGIAEEEVY